PGSWRARRSLAMDRSALAAADVVLCDTWAQGALYESLGCARDKLRRVLVGAEPPFFEIPPPHGAGMHRRADGVAPVRVLSAGGFLPLHGVPVMIEAAGRLERAGRDDFELVLVGDGIEYPEARAAIHSLG